MADNDGTNANDGTTGTQDGPKKVELSEAEFNELKANAAKGKVIDNIEADTGRPFDEYLTEAEDALDEKIERDKTPPDKKPDGGNQDPNKSKEAPPAGLSEADRNLLAASSATSKAALLISAEAKFTMEQAQLEADKRSPFTSTELRKSIVDDEQTVLRVAAKYFGGDMFKAADHLLSLSPEGQAKINAAAGKKTDDAAKAGANIPASGAAPAGGGDLTGDEYKKAVGDEIANRIAPAGGGYTGK